MSASRQQLSRFAAVFAGGTLVSRILGLARDMLIGALITTASRDAFILAFKLPNMFRELIGEGAMNAAFVPVLSHSHETDSPERFRELVSAAMSTMLIVLGFMTVMGMVFIPEILRALPALQRITGGAGIAQGDIDMMVSLSRWTFPYLFLIGMAVFAMGPLFTVKQYTTSSWSPALLNVAIIICCLLLRDRFSDQAYALVVGVWLGGIAQLVVQFMALAKHTGVWWPNFHLDHPAIWKVFLLMGPVLIGQAAGEVNKLVDVLFARSLGEGIVNAFFYANRLIQLPLSMFGFAVAAAILPSLSKSASRGDHAEVRDTLIHGLRQSYFLVFPSLLGLLFFGRPLVELLFQRGHWNELDTEYTVRSLAIYSLGLLSFAWVKVSVTGFFCMNDTKTPVIVSSASMLLNILLNIALVRPMGYQGLALATTISYTVNFAVLYTLLGKRFGNLWDNAMLTALLRMTIAGVAMVAVAYAAHVRVVTWLVATPRLAHVLGVVVLLLAAACTYLLMCRALRVEEYGHFASALRRKAGRQ